jgi:hypothetical protein
MIINKINDTNATFPVIKLPVVVVMSKNESTPLFQQKSDIINITSAARVKSMKLEGMSVAQIAVVMGLDTEAIWAFLKMQPLASAQFPSAESP